MSELLFVDVQAVGSPGGGFLLEVAWKPESGPAHSFLVRRVRADIPERIQSITGISPWDLSSPAAVPEEEVRELFMAAAGLHQGQTPRILVAHYSVYEKRWLDNLTGRDLAFVCTRDMARRNLDNLRSGSLRAVAGHTGCSMGEKRRALQHVLATEAVYMAMQTGFTDVLVPREERLALPAKPGVYRFYDAAGRLLYVGKAKNLRSRVNSHFTGRSRGRHAELMSRVCRIEHEVLETAFHAAVRESSLISLLSPEYNSAGRIRSHKLWFLSGDLLEVHEQDRDSNCFGPLLSQNPAVEFARFVSIILSGEFSSEIVENLFEKAPFALVSSVLKEWRIDVLKKGILQYGKELFPGRLERDSGEDPEESEVIDEQYVRARLDSMIREGTHMCRKSAAVRLLEGSSVTWSDTASEEIVHNFVDNSLSKTWDQAKVRKLQVVLSEVRRVYRAGSAPRVITASGKILESESLESLFNSV